MCIGVGGGEVGCRPYTVGWVDTTQGVDGGGGGGSGRSAGLDPWGWWDVSEGEGSNGDGALEGKGWNPRFEAGRQGSKGVEGGDA